MQKQNKYRTLLMCKKRRKEWRDGGKANKQTHNFGKPSCYHNYCNLTTCSGYILNNHMPQTVAIIIKIF